ncbi:hypothetical protein [Streptomyces sp. 6N106]|uniref:hypothetical protein n=1 Tax=Streptomyces sp. 6N106 TaxID=3457418 RepID=UPI003FD34481
MMHTIRTAAAAAMLLLGGVAVPVTLATPASATQSQCMNWLQRHGYTVGEKVADACAVGARGGAFNYAKCVTLLTNAGVKNGDNASKACDHAA